MLFVESNCGWKNNSYGPAEYYKCIKTQMNQLGSSQKPDMSKINKTNRNAIESNCGWKNNSYGPDIIKCIKIKWISWVAPRKPDMIKVNKRDRRCCWIKLWVEE